MIPNICETLPTLYKNPFDVFPNGVGLMFPLESNSQKYRTGKQTSRLTIYFMVIREVSWKVPSNTYSSFTLKVTIRLPFSYYLLNPLLYE